VLSSRSSKFHSYSLTSTVQRGGEVKQSVPQMYKGEWKESPLCYRVVILSCVQERVKESLRV